MLPDGYNIPSILRELESCIQSEDLEEDRRHTDRTFRHYPSSASIVMPDGTVEGSCLRQVYYRATGQPESNISDFSNVLQRRFGDAIHKQLLETLEESELFRLKSEVPGRVIIDPLTKELSFRMDGVINHEGVKGGLEIKTTQGRSLQYGSKDPEPKKSYSLQVSDYFLANPDIQWFSLVVVARDSAFRTEHHYTKEEDGIYIHPIIPSGSKFKLTWLVPSKTIERRLALEKHLADGTLPPRDFKVVRRDDGSVTDKRTRKGVDYKSHFMCAKYCEFRDHCLSLPDALSDSIKIPD